MVDSHVDNRLLNLGPLLLSPTSIKLSLLSPPLHRVSHSAFLTPSHAILTEIRVIEESNALVRAGKSRVVQLLLGTAPYAGGVGSLLSTQAQKRQEARLRRLLLELVKVVDDRAHSSPSDVDIDHLRSEPFVALVTDILEEVTRSGDETRLHYLRSFLVSASLKQRPDESWIDLFQRYLGRLSGTHMAVLHEIYDRQRGISASDRLGSVKLTHVPICIDDIRTPTYKMQLLRVTLADLANLGLLADWRILSGDSSFQECYSLTRNGMFFTRFLLQDWNTEVGKDPVD